MPSEPSAEAREKCRETLFAIMVTRGSVDQMLDAIIPIIERDTANRIWEEAAKLFSAKATELKIEGLIESASNFNDAAYMCRSRISGD